MCRATTRSPSFGREASTGSCAADGHPVGVDLEHDLRGELAREVLERGDALDGALDLVGVVVVADADAVAGGDLGGRVELVGDLRDVVRGLPALGRDERVDHRLDAERLRGARRPRRGRRR